MIQPDGCMSRGREYKLVELSFQIANGGFLRAVDITPCKNMLRVQSSKGLRSMGAKLIVRLSSDAAVELF